MVCGGLASNFDAVGDDSCVCSAHTGELAVEIYRGAREQGNFRTSYDRSNLEGEEGALEEEVWKSEEAEGLLRRYFLSFDKL
jgi:hypothetical protein